MTLERLNNLEDLEALLRKLHEVDTINGIGFDMNREYAWRRNTDHPCGSACCIGGWVQACNPETSFREVYEAVLTISPPETHLQQAYLLCYPSSPDELNEGLNYYQAPALWAAYAVKIFRETGKANWPEAERLAKAELTSE